MPDLYKTAPRISAKQYVDGKAITEPTTITDIDSLTDDEKSDLFKRLEEDLII